MRPLKLIAYAILGYVIYEMIQGMQRPQHAARDSRPRQRRRLDPGDVDTGIEQSTLDTQGGSMRHRVGRGVVQ